MKFNYLLALAVVCTTGTAATAQSISSLAPVLPHLPTTEIFDLNGKPWNINNPDSRINGTPWLNANWNTGYVQLTDGKRADSILMNIDLEYNRVVFLVNNIVHEFSSLVQEAVYDYIENGVNKTALFRTGYPEKDGRKTTTLYQVLGEGPKYHLIQYSDKKTMERREYNGPATLYYELSSSLYIYDPTAKTMQKIKNKKSSVIDALPGKKEAIEKICSDNNLDLKSGEQIAMLISKLQ